LEIRRVHAVSRLENLSDVDFEDLCRDIAQAETGLRFSAFGPGPDGGIDGRHAKGDKQTILQCKHYIGSSFSQLESAIGREAKKLPKLKPDRYLLFTSQSLTPPRSQKLSAVFGDFLKELGDIWGKEDIEAALRKHPAIEKAHLKLWLSSTAVLERILRSGLEAYTHATKQEILRELKVYVRNESFDEASKKLEEQRVLVISGPPGVGKTTLAKMLSYHYLNEGWHFRAIKSLDEGFAQIDGDAPTIFFFDDFLGRIQLDWQSLLQRESAMAIFVRRVRDSKNARFVLTTRAHIFEEARRISDYVDDKHFQLAKYLLDVGSYTRKIKSYILFNHLAASNLTRDHFAALLQGDWLKKIIDHKNYNPRVIASASSDSLDVVAPEQYPTYLYSALQNPDLIWSKPFRALNTKSQNLLISMFFGSEFGESIDDTKVNFSELHRTISAHYSQPTTPTDFEDSLKSLESGFISISGGRVSFVNPSLRDFLKSFLNDKEFLLLLPDTAQRVDWARGLWRHIKELFGTHPEFLRQVATAFSAYSARIDTTPSMKKTKSDGYWTSSPDDLPVTQRVELLLHWWEASGQDRFIERALSLFLEGKLDFVSWRDGSSLPELHWWVFYFVGDELPVRAELLEAIAARLVETVESGMAVDDLIQTIEKVHSYIDDVSKELDDAIDRMVRHEFNETRDAIGHLDSEQSLSEHLEYLDSLAKLTGYDATDAKRVVFGRLAELEEKDHDEYRPSFSRHGRPSPEEFGDAAVSSLFGNLVKQP
jgi:DNA polymerase III delta prime subunit